MRESSSGKQYLNHQSLSTINNHHASTNWLVIKQHASTPNEIKTMQINSDDRHLQKTPTTR